MKHIAHRTTPGTAPCMRPFPRVLAMAALSTGIVLATATLALAFSDSDDNPPGPRGGPGTNWENPPGPRGGPGASPDTLPWRPKTLRRIYNAQQPPVRPWTLRRIYNSLNPPTRVQPWTARRIYNATHPPITRRFHPNPRRRMR